MFASLCARAYERERKKRERILVLGRVCLLAHVLQSVRACTLVADHSRARGPASIYLQCMYVCVFAMKRECMSVRKYKQTYPVTVCCSQHAVHAGACSCAMRDHVLLPQRMRPTTPCLRVPALHSQIEVDVYHSLLIYRILQPERQTSNRSC